MMRALERASFATVIHDPEQDSGETAMKSEGFSPPLAVALGIALTTALSFFVVFALSGIKSQLFGIQEYDHRRGGDAMLFPDWLAIAVLVFLLVWAVSAWIQQHKS